MAWGEKMSDQLGEDVTQMKLAMESPIFSTTDTHHFHIKVLPTTESSYWKLKTDKFWGNLVIFSVGGNLALFLWNMLQFFAALKYTDSYVINRN